MNNLGILYHYEMKKLLLRKVTWISLLVGIIIISGMIISDMVGDYYVGDKYIDTKYNMYVTDQNYRKALDGRTIDQSLLEEMASAYNKVPKNIEKYSQTEEYQKYARPYSEIFNFVRDAMRMNVENAMLWSPNEKNLYQERNNVLEEIWEDKNLSNKEKEYWRNKELTIEKPFVYYDTENYFMIIRLFSVMSLLVLLLESFCLSNLFSEEHSRRTDQLILSSKNGKNTLYCAKLLAGISLTFGLILIFTIVSLSLIFFIYGTNGMNAIFQLILTNYSYPITIGEAIIIMYVCLFITGIVFSIIIMVLSEILGRSIHTLTITSGAIILAMVFKISSQYRLLSQIWDYLPTKFMLSYENIFDIRLINIFGSYFTSWQFVPIIYILSSIFILFIGKKVYTNYQVGNR